MNILVVEDEALIAMQLRDSLLRAGHHVVGPFASVERGMGAIESQHLDFALLDIQLGEERVFPVADELGRRGIPFAFLTGFDTGALPPAFADRPCLTKPVDPKELLEKLAAFRLDEG